FYGRESEMQNILKLLDQESPRIAILGGGGMGKTSFAKAVLHHPETITKFEHRFFISAEPATTAIELAGLIGLHLGLEPGKDLTKPIIQYLSRKAACLLILDSLETPWEPIHSRGGIEELLSLLTEVSHLTLIITMRGAERPGKVHWTHPFLSPLEPFSDDAAWKTFSDITDNSVETKDMHELLQLTDNMPLAVDLIAHLVDYQGASMVLTQWAAEKTSLLSVGHDRTSNLDASITISLSSPRLTTGAKELLSLLSILPDGLSDLELIQSNLPIENVRACKAALLATSLAYQDEKKQLRSLTPIRQHIQQFFFPRESLIQAVFKHLHSLLQLYKKYNDQQLVPLV
ncbi:P-loop containing nucleoside triphosphate hydrolase protein, partial [Mycena olivaceomarginata]